MSTWDGRLPSWYTSIQPKLYINWKIQKMYFSEQTKQAILHEMWLKKIKLQKNIQEMYFKVLFCIFVPKSTFLNEKQSNGKSIP